MLLEILYVKIKRLYYPVPICRCRTLPLRAVGLFDTSEASTVSCLKCLLSCKGTCFFLRCWFPHGGRISKPSRIRRAAGYDLVVSLLIPFSCDSASFTSRGRRSFHRDPRPLLAVS